MYGMYLLELKGQDILLLQNDVAEKPPTSIIIEM